MKQDLRLLPAVRAVTDGGTPLWSPIPGQDRQKNTAVHAEGRTHHLPIGTVTGGPGYCEAIGVRILAGRDLDRADWIPGAKPVAVIGRRLADALWPGRNPIGSGFRLLGVDGPEVQAAGEDAAADTITVVGIATDSVRRGIRAEPLMTIYRPEVRSLDEELSYRLVVSTRGDADRVVGEALDVARRGFPGAYTLEAVTAKQLIAREFTRERMAGTLVCWFAAIAAIVSLVGTAGLVACAVTRRAPEFGLRLALGAPRAAVIRLAASSGVMPVLAGCLAGAAVTPVVMRVSAIYLFELGTLDVATLAACTGLFLLASMIAALWPAWRAALADPLVVLKSE